MRRSHPVERSALIKKMTRQGVLDEYVKTLCVVNPENYYSNWPPPPQKTVDQIKEMSSEVMEWLETLSDDDELWSYSTCRDLAGDGGYVAFRDVTWLSTFVVFVS